MKLSKSESSYCLTWARKIMAVNELGDVCQTCGEKNMFKLCFHHKNKNDKEFDFSSLSRLALTRYKKEIKKCKLLCRNCHYKKHFKVNDIKKKLLEIYGKDYCEKCGHCGPALEFHHIKEQKKFNLGEVTGKKLRLPLETIILEMEKCILLCSNCHKVEHIDIDKFIKFKEAIYKKVRNPRERPPPVNKESVLRMKKQGINQSEIGRRLGYAKSTISRVVNMEKARE